MVKNVRPGALAGNLQPLHPEPTEESEVEGNDVDVLDAHDVTGVVVPTGDLDARLAWVSEAADTAEAALRADAIWQHETASDPDSDKATLAASLREAVAAVIDGTEDNTDGDSEAVNADTGQVTQPGDPLPPIEQQEGTPLPASSGDDSDPAVSEPTGDPVAAQDSDQGTDEGQNSTGSDDVGNASD